MVSKHKRILGVYEHLRQYYGIHTQTDFADAEGHALGVAGIAGVTMQRNVSANFSGNVFRGGASMWIGTEDDWQEVERTF